MKSDYAKRAMMKLLTLGHSIEYLHENTVILLSQEEYGRPWHVEELPRPVVSSRMDELLNAKEVPAVCVCTSDMSKRCHNLEVFIPMQEVH